MIKRIWHGWTATENADRYFEVLTGQVIPAIEAKALPGYLGIEVLRQQHDSEVEFITIMSFRSIDDIIAFQGPDYERSHVPDVAQAVLKRFDRTAQHYELLIARDAQGNLS